MEFQQRTIPEIIESEKLMVQTAPDRYGAHYENAMACSLFLSTCIKSVDQSRTLFAMFLSQVKKYHLLAVFSTVRLHQVQSVMNLRHTLEAGASATYAIANIDPADFVDTDEKGILDPSKRLTQKRYAWLDKNYPDHSREMKAMKDLINASMAHANLLHTNNTSKMDEAAGHLSAPFFDIEESWFVQADLWRIANAGIGLMGFFYAVSSDHKGLVFADQFEAKLNQLARENARIHAEMTSSERCKRAMKVAES
jgi:hypothetical protein